HQISQAVPTNVSHSWSLFPLAIRFVDRRGRMGMKRRDYPLLIIAIVLIQRCRGNSRFRTSPPAVHTIGLGSVLSDVSSLFMAESCIVRLRVLPGAAKGGADRGI